MANFLRNIDAFTVPLEINFDEGLVTRNAEGKYVERNEMNPFNRNLSNVKRGLAIKFKEMLAK